MALYYPAQLLVVYSAANVRLFFRIYFIVLGIVIAPIGQACSAAATRLKLAKGKDVKLTEMLGWLGGFDTLSSLWKLRAFPSGPLLTLFMLTAYIVGLASDLVGVYIRTVEVRDQCTFGTGLVLSATRSMGLVPWNGYPYTVIQQASSLSLANDGLQGIYAKVNQDGRFSAVDADVLGTWVCTQNPLELVYPVNDSPFNVVTDLVNHGLLYNINTAAPEWSNANTSIEHITILDTSNDGALNATWDLRASTSTYNAESNTNTMLSFQCTLDDRVGWLTEVLKGINTESTMADWIQIVQGSLYSGTGTPARANLGSILEKQLNTMVMIASGGNNLLDSSQSSSTQGCLTDRTWILWEVVGLALIAALLNVLLLVYLVCLKLLEKKYRRQDHYSTTADARSSVQKRLEVVPVDFLGWTSQAVEESRLVGQAGIQNTNRSTKPRELKHRKFGWLDLDNRFGVLKDGEQSEQVSLLIQRPK